MIMQVTMSVRNELNERGGFERLYIASRNNPPLHTVNDEKIKSFSGQ